MNDLALLPPAHLIASALEELAQRCADALAGLKTQSDQGDPTVKEERQFWTRQQRAFDKALHYWLSGVRPTRTPSGDWLIPSGSQAGRVIHRITRHGGVWVCGDSCEAGRRGVFHWHSALIVGIERAEELAEGADDGDVREGGASVPPQGNPIPHAAEAAEWLHGRQLLASRLEATARYVASLRQAQRRQPITHIGRAYQRAA